jgi:hypothetical protein
LVSRSSTSTAERASRGNISKEMTPRSSTFSMTTLIYYVNTVLICHEKEEDRKTTKGCIAYRYSTLPVLETNKVEPGSEDGYDSEERPEFDSGSDSDLEDGHTYCHTTGNVVRGASFHLPGASAVEKILKQQLAEWLGYEEQDQEQMKYYAAGMFVKNGGGSSVHEGSIQTWKKVARERSIQTGMKRSEEEASVLRPEARVMIIVVKRRTKSPNRSFERALSVGSLSLRRKAALTQINSPPSSLLSNLLVTSKVQTWRFASHSAFE